MSDVFHVQQERIKEFIEELSGFAQIAEETLSQIEKNLEGNKGLFSIFSERMLAIRGTAMQLNLQSVAMIAGLGEEIAIKGCTAGNRPQIRKCVGSLWDALTTVKHMLVHFDEETTEEQGILVNRLQNTLNSFGGARAMVNEDDIEALLKKRI